MILRRQSIRHAIRYVSFTDDGRAVKVAYSDRLGVAELSPLDYLGTSDMVVDAPLAWAKDRSRVG
jgi:hypothetical protein